MKVQILKATNWDGEFRRAGDQFDVPDKVGQRWVNHKIAAEVGVAGGQSGKQNDPPKSATFTELKERAKRLDIKGYNKMKQDELIAAIAEVEKAAAEQEAEELAALKLQADALEIEGFEEMTKEQLVEAIEAAEKD